MSCVHNAQYRKCWTLIAITEKATGRRYLDSSYGYSRVRIWSLTRLLDQAFDSDGQMKPGLKVKWHPLARAWKNSSPALDWTVEVLCCSDVDPELVRARRTEEENLGCFFNPPRATEARKLVLPPLPSLHALALARKSRGRDGHFRTGKTIKRGKTP